MSLKCKINKMLLCGDSDCLHCTAVLNSKYFHTLIYCIIVKLTVTFININKLDYEADNLTSALLY